MLVVAGDVEVVSTGSRGGRWEVEVYALVLHSLGVVLVVALVVELVSTGNLGGGDYRGGG